VLSSLQQTAHLVAQLANKFRDLCMPENDQWLKRYGPMHGDVPGSHHEHQEQHVLMFLVNTVLSQHHPCCCLVQSVDVCLCYSFCLHASQLVGMTLMMALALCAVVALQTSQQRRVQLVQMGVAAEDENDGEAENPIILYRIQHQYD
jgi:hypothetical protein